MNIEERRTFWETLCSLERTNPEEDCQRIRDSIKFPDKLYRYRSVSVSSIDALQTNRLYFSTANYYDDPFDTLIKIDYNAIRQQCQQILAPAVVGVYVDALCKQLGSSEEEKAAMEEWIKSLPISDTMERVVNHIKGRVQSLLKENMWSCCFSENGNNEVMWMKYADKYKGFCVIYDLKADENWYCGKQEKCKNCVVNNDGVSLYPIHYSDDGYDATQLAKDIVVDQVLRSIPPEIAKKLSSGSVVKPWEREKVALIKSECHKYDEEWRMILRGPAKAPIMMEWVPYGVILGMKTTPQHRETIVRSAKIAGICHIYESYINDESKLDVREISV